MSDNILEIRGISKSFYRQIVNPIGKKDRETTFLLNGLDLDIRRGVISALIGGNGTGKTTLFNLVCGHLKPDIGFIRYLPGDGATWELTRLPVWRSNRIGIGRMFQEAHIFRDLTVLENMLVADENPQGENPFAKLLRPRFTRHTEARRTEEAKMRLDTLLGEHNPLWEKRHHKAGSLSYGQQRLLSLARIFMNNSLKLILLDEPGAGVNPDIISRMKDILQRLRTEGKSVLLIEHNIAFVRDVADETHYLSAGCVMYSGKTTEILEKEEIITNYSGNL